MQLAALSMHVLLAIVLWLASTHPAAKKAPLHGSLLSPSMSEKMSAASSSIKEHAAAAVKEH